MIKQRNCKQCNKLFFPKRLNGVSCSFNCIKLGRVLYLKDYRKLKTTSISDNKKTRMPKLSLS